MKRILSLLLICILTLGLLSGCDRKAANGSASNENETVNFAPEATAVAAEQPAAAPEAAAEPTQEAPVDAPAEAAEADAQSSASSDVQPFVTATPQPNTQISAYSEVTQTGLGFKLSYPTGWNNIPGRSTVCYVQPLENGTEYPARVAVTMKRLAHKCSDETIQTELAEYVKVLMTQYDEKTFEVSKELDTSTQFMGKKGYSATYLAYDGSQEIQGYIIATYFERYVFVYHFLCAYEDYEAFGTAMRRMRDSVQAEQTAESSD